MLKTCNINKQRLWNTIMELGKIGEDPQGGVTRTSLSHEDMQGREYVIHLMKQAGLTVRIDEVGNIFGRLPGKNEDAPVVLTGSHIDTVIQGGIFDGTLGVLGAIEAVRSIREKGVDLTHPIEVVSFTDEEGARFGAGFIGSKAMIGQLEESYFELVDAEGVSYAEAFRRVGLDPLCFREAARDSGMIKAYVEMHVEQGRVLETNDLPVGIVTDIQGPIWMFVYFRGQADHAGATPMEIRRDASLAMAEVLPVIEQVAIKWNGVATVGKMHFKPGGVNIIPEEVMFSIDFRHVDKKMRQKMKEEILQTLQSSAERRRLDVEVDIKMEVDPVACSPSIIQVIKKSCEELNLPVFEMKCGAGHDALLVSKITDFGMIFVRSREGISHSPREWSSMEDCAKGTQLLMQTLLHLAR